MLKLCVCVCLTIAKLTDLTVLLFQLLTDLADGDVVAEGARHLADHPGGGITGRPQVVALQGGEARVSQATSATLRNVVQPYQHCYCTVNKMANWVPEVSLQVLTRQVTHQAVVFAAGILAALQQCLLDDSDVKLSLVLCQLLVELP